MNQVRKRVLKAAADGAWLNPALHNRLKAKGYRSPRAIYKAVKALWKKTGRVDLTVLLRAPTYLPVTCLVPGPHSISPTREMVKRFRQLWAKRPKKLKRR